MVLSTKLDHSWSNSAILFPALFTCVLILRRRFRCPWLRGLIMVPFCCLAKRTSNFRCMLSVKSRLASCNALRCSSNFSSSTVNVSSVSSTLGGCTTGCAVAALHPAPSVASSFFITRLEGVVGIHGALTGKTAQSVPSFCGFCSSVALYEDAAFTLLLLERLFGCVHTADQWAWHVRQYSWRSPLFCLHAWQNQVISTLCRIWRGICCHWKEWCPDSVQIHFLSLLRVLFPRSTKEALLMKLLHLCLVLRSFRCHNGSLMFLARVVDVGPNASPHAKDEESTTHPRPKLPWG